MHLFIFSIFVFLQTVFTQDYNVRDFGAVGDGIVDDTEAIRKALAAAENTHGGRVIFDSGYTFNTGSIRLTNNVIMDVRGMILGTNVSERYTL